MIVHHSLDGLVNGQKENPAVMSNYSNYESPPNLIGPSVQNIKISARPDLS